MEHQYAAGFCLSNDQQEFSLFCPTGTKMEVFRIFLGAHNYSPDRNCFMHAGDCVDDIGSKTFGEIQKRCSIDRKCTYNYADNMKTNITCGSKTMAPEYFQINYTCADGTLLTLYICVGVLAFLLLVALVILVTLRLRQHIDCQQCGSYDDTEKPPKHKPHKSRDPIDDHTYVNEEVILRNAEPVQRWSSVADYDDIIAEEHSNVYVRDNYQGDVLQNNTKSKESTKKDIQTRSLPKIPGQKGGYENLAMKGDDHGYVVPVPTPPDNTKDKTATPEHVVSKARQGDAKDKLLSSNPAASQNKQGDAKDRPGSSQPAASKIKQGDARKNPDKVPEKIKQYESDSIKSIKGKIKVKSVVQNIDIFETNTML